MDLVKLFLGRDDLEYPFVLKANYFVIDPRKNGFVFVIYTIISRIYINFFLMSFYVMDLFLVTLFFYVSSYMEAVKLKMRLLAETNIEMDELEMTQSLKAIVDDHVTAISMVKSLDEITRCFMISQSVLFSFSFCFILFNMTQVREGMGLGVCFCFITLITIHSR